MEKHIQRKINNYCLEYRNVYLRELDEIINMLNKKEVNSKIIERINDMKINCAFVSFPEIKKGEFKKTKRINSIVPENEKCNALCCGGIRCSRRKQTGSLYCGTHTKGQPNGTIHEDNIKNNIMNSASKIEISNKVNYVYPVNENGIVKLYLDENKNYEINANDFMKKYVVDG